MESSLSERTFRPLQRYEQIAERLAADIRSGLLAPGERLPSERELARTLEVSRASVREAIAALQLQGVVETRPGAGTFVAAEPPPRRSRRTTPARPPCSRRARSSSPRSPAWPPQRAPARRGRREPARRDGGDDDPAIPTLARPGTPPTACSTASSRP